MEVSLVHYVEYVALYAARLSPLFLMPSLLPLAKLPKTIKVLLVVSVAVILAFSGESVPSALLQNMTQLEFILAIGSEFLVGVALVFGVQITFAALLFAGKIIDLQFGFGVASVLDPMTRTSEALIGSALNILFTVIFFVLDCHLLLLEAVAATFIAFPVGQYLVVPNITSMLGFISGQFVLGLLVVMPTMLGLFLLDTVIALASRSMPQVNVYFVSLPVKIFIGILLLSVSLKYMSGLLEQLLFHSVTSWFDVLDVAKES